MDETDEWACCHWPEDAKRAQREIERLRGICREVREVLCRVVSVHPSDRALELDPEWPRLNDLLRSAKPSVTTDAHIRQVVRAEHSELCLENDDLAEQVAVLDGDNDQLTAQLGVARGIIRTGLMWCQQGNLVKAAEDLQRGLDEL